MYTAYTRIHRVPRAPDVCSRIHCCIERPIFRALRPRAQHVCFFIEQQSCCIWCIHHNKVYGTFSCKHIHVYNSDKRFRGFASLVSATPVSSVSQLWATPSVCVCVSKAALSQLLTRTFIIHLNRIGSAESGTQRWLFTPHPRNVNCLVVCGHEGASCVAWDMKAIRSLGMHADAVRTIGSVYRCAVVGFKSA